MDKTYFPIIKTTDAEIKGLFNLDKAVFESSLPILELTRSRPLKDFPRGDIHRRMGQIEEIFENYPFILDLTAHSDLSNSQIETLQDDTDGFSEWRKFLQQYKHLNIVPTLHYYDEGPLEEFSNLAKSLLETGYKQAAVRVSIESQEKQVQFLTNSLGDLLSEFEKLYFVFDADYIDQNSYQQKLNWYTQTLPLAASHGVKNAVIATSSFPKSVLDRENTEDHVGQFEILEISILKACCDIKEDTPKILYGDYASIHPLRKAQSGGSWVPRIDHSNDTHYVYRRYRQREGGYLKAAKNLFGWQGVYDPIDSWGASEIKEASEASTELELGGRSPSHWISVRLNQHVTRFSQLKY